MTKPHVEGFSSGLAVISSSGGNSVTKTPECDDELPMTEDFVLSVGREKNGKIRVSLAKKNVRIVVLRISDP